MTPFNREQLVSHLLNTFIDERLWGTTYRKAVERLLSEIEAAGWEVREKGKESEHVPTN